MDLWKQMSSSKCSFTCICGIFWPLNLSTTTVYARSAFYPSLRFTLSLQSAFYTLSAFYPWSAVCSPQSAFYTDRFINTTHAGFHGWSEYNVTDICVECHCLLSLCLNVKRPVASKYDMNWLCAIRSQTLTFDWTGSSEIGLLLFGISWQISVF